MEVWKTVKGFEGIYMVSNMGRLFSEGRGRILNPSVSAGYLRCKLCVNGVASNVRVHRLVAEAFLPEPNEDLKAYCAEFEPNGLVIVRHLDGDKLNNKVENLAWGTSKDNYEDFVSSTAYAGWLGSRGSKVFTDDDIRYIRKVYQPRHTEFGGVALAEKFGKTKQYIRKIVSREIYKDI